METPTQYEVIMTHAQIVRAMTALNEDATRMAKFVTDESPEDDYFVRETQVARDAYRACLKSKVLR